MAGSAGERIAFRSLRLVESWGVPTWLDVFGWLRGVDLNHRPLGYEPNELPDCSTPHNDATAGSRPRQTGTVPPPFLARCALPRVGRSRATRSPKGREGRGSYLMKIAQVAPLHESVPPKYYGGTERIVSYLTEELVRQGHEVTLFATADSYTKARLVPVSKRSLRLDGNCQDHMAHHVLLLEHVAQFAREFDLIHYHIDYLHFPLSRRQRTAHLTTLHGRLDLPDLRPLFAEFHDMPVVSISHAQRLPLPDAHWVATVHHGLPENLFTLEDRPGKHLVFLGRLCREKGPDQAVEIARRAGLELKVAAKVDSDGRPFFDEVLQPLFRQPGVQFLGEISECEKQELLRDALALLFPINWPEPFGLVLIEAMACGVPVIAYPRGSAPEIVEDGVTGFLVPDAEAAVRAVGRVSELSRSRCRQVFEERFSAARMARDYITAYERVAHRGPVALSA
jgi:glycosyltransferase involved in cell wall biosynthesis